MKHLLLIMMSLLLMVSCSYTPEERAEKVVKEYCKAILDNEYKKVSSLTYDKGSDEVAVDITEPEEPLVSNLSLKIGQKCVLNSENEFNIINVERIYSTPTLNEETAACDSVVEEVACRDSVGAETSYTAEKPSQNVTSWPSEVVAAYEVVVKSGIDEIIFTVVQLDKNEFKVYSTKGLYKYDFSDVTKKTGCIPKFPEDVDDETMEQNVCRFTDDIKTFDIFSKAIAANDSSKIVRIFPRLANYEYTFKGTPAPESYSLIGNYAVITTRDSLAFQISLEGKIIDSYGVISTKIGEDAVKKLDGTPRLRGDYFDIEYLNLLSEQVSSLEREKERKAKAARYKAQGVALISSHFTNDGNGAKGVEFTALNTSNKTAKYVIMEVVGYNSVDDPVWSNGYLKRCRGIGPIASGEGGSWDFNNIWENGDIVSSYEIKTLTIQFTDGTSKSIRLPRSLPSDWRDWLY